MIPNPEGSEPAPGEPRWNDSDIQQWLRSATAPDTGLVIMPLRKMEKLPIWTKAIALRHMDAFRARTSSEGGQLVDALKWMGRGNNLGLNFVWSHIWVLDIDGMEGLPASVFKLLNREDIPQVLTPSGGRHLYFSLPLSLRSAEGMKAHVIHPKIDGLELPLDVKLGGGFTYTVAPGSQTEKGHYVPITPWRNPPILDPRDVVPGINIFKTTTSLKKQKKWDPAPRSEEHHVFAAYAYLKKAKASEAGNHGRDSLTAVLVHLLNFLGLEPRHVLHLVTNPPGRSWNDRCIDSKTGRPYPWSRDELVSAIESCKGLSPYAGVELRKRRIRNERRDARLAKAMMILKFLWDPEGEMFPVAYLREDVCRTMKVHVSECTATRFGRLLRKSGIMTIVTGPLKERCVRLRVSSRDEFRNHLKT